MTKATVARSALAGVIWGGIGVTIVRALTGGEYFGGRRSLWEMRGALIAAPLIGVLVGLWSPLFRRSGLVGRTVIAVVTLYLAAGAFMVAASRTMNGIAETLNETFLALTVTGLVLVLAPLAYLSHLLVSTREPDATAEAAPRLTLRE